MALLLRSSLTFDNLKTSLFFYVFASYVLKSYRHVLARGAIQTLNEGRVAVARVCLPLSTSGAYIF